MDRSLHDRGRRLHARPLGFTSEKAAPRRCLFFSEESMMRRSIVVGTGLVLLTTLLVSAERSDRTLGEATDLLSGPEGARVAVLLPGATVRVTESRPGWERVEMEGWIKTEEISPAGVPAEAAPAAPAPQQAAAAPGSIAGAVFVTDQEGRTTIGASMALRLLADPERAAEEVGAITTECESSTSALKAEAEALKAKGSRAMKTIENPSAAFEAYDEAKRERGKKLRDLRKLDEECSQRKEAALDSHTVQRTLSDAQGRYTFDKVPAGPYTLHGLLESGDVRHEWDVEIVVEPGRRLSLDLTNANRSRSGAAPVYR